MLQYFVEGLPGWVSWSVHEMLSEHAMGAVSNIARIGWACGNFPRAQAWTKRFTQADKTLRRNMCVTGKSIGQQRNVAGFGPLGGQLQVEEPGPSKELYGAQRN